MDRRQNFLRYFDNIDDAGLRQRSLFLRYFEDFKAAGLDPVAVMDLAFSINSGVFLRRAIAGMELFRDRCRPPIEFFWGLENAPSFVPDPTKPPPPTPPPTWTRERIFRLLNGLLNWDDPAGAAAVLDAIVSRDERKAAEFWRDQKILAIETVGEVAAALPGIASKFGADGQTPESLPGIPGKTIAAGLSAYFEKRKRERRRGPPSLREIAVTILLMLERSDEDPAAVLGTLNTIRKEERRAPRKPRRAKTLFHRR